MKYRFRKEKLRKKISGSLAKIASQGKCIAEKTCCPENGVRLHACKTRLKITQLEKVSLIKVNTLKLTEIELI